MVLVIIFTWVKKKFEEKLLQDIQSEKEVNIGAGAKKADGTVITVTTNKSEIKKTFSYTFAIPLGFYFFKHHVYFYVLKEDFDCKAWIEFF